MSAQRYTNPISLGRLAEGNCPECGFPPGDHNGSGGPLWCTLTGNGVAARIAQYTADQETAGS